MGFVRSVRRLKVVKSRSSRWEPTITLLMAVALPAMATAAAITLNASEPLVVLAAGAGGLISAYWTGRMLTTRSREAVDLRIDNRQTTDDLMALRNEIEFRERFHDALRESTSESSTIELTLRAVTELIPDGQVSFLLSQPDNVRLGWAITLHEGHLDPAVPIGNSPRCRALERRSTIRARSNHAVGACEHLAGQSIEVSSLCMPLALGDRTLGIVNIIGAPGEPPADELVSGLEWIVEHAAVRMAEQRLDRGPSKIGAVDPVTGLAGREAFRTQLKDLIRALQQFSVAIISIDRYEELINENGSDAGDTMLLATSDALMATLRPDDFVCRYDDSTFAVVLPGCDSARAAGVIERVRESLTLLLVVEGENTFTCSAGVAESSQATSLNQLIEMAESTCARATAAGGNRVLVTFSTDHM